MVVRMERPILGCSEGARGRVDGPATGAASGILEHPRISDGDGRQQEGATYLGVAMLRPS